MAKLQFSLLRGTMARYPRSRSVLVGWLTATGLALASQTGCSAFRQAVRLEVNLEDKSVERMGLQTAIDTHCPGVTIPLIADVWGQDNEGKVSGPDGKTGYSDLATGYEYTCALDGSDRPTCWGNDSRDKVTDVPVTQFESLSPGYDFVCGRTSDRRLECWGSESDTDTPNRIEPADGQYRDYDAGRYVSCGIDLTGSLQCWGDDEKDLFSLLTDVPTP